VKDFANPAIEPYLKRYVRGSHGIEYQERIKIIKLLWDAIGTEFGGRHELYERNYAGSWEDIRAQSVTTAECGGRRPAPLVITGLGPVIHILRFWTDEDMDADLVPTPPLPHSHQDAVRQSAEQRPVVTALCRVTP
jgi:4-hydroxyphenylacetate 3-hydroxylase C terminal